MDETRWLINVFPSNEILWIIFFFGRFLDLLFFARSSHYFLFIIFVCDFLFPVLEQSSGKSCCCCCCANTTIIIRLLSYDYYHHDDVESVLVQEQCSTITKSLFFLRPSRTTGNCYHKQQQQQQQRQQQQQCRSCTGSKVHEADTNGSRIVTTGVRIESFSRWIWYDEIIYRW